jgi:ligand-binding sensor domain-containing protein/signal transduction histidine kinase
MKLHCGVFGIMGRYKPCDTARAGQPVNCVTIDLRIAVFIAVMLPLSLSSAAQPLPGTNESRFVSYSRRVWHSADGLPEDLAQAIAQTHDGYLWIGTSGGLVRFDGMRFTAFNHENTPAFRDDSVYSLFTSNDGTLWAGTEGGGLIRYKQGVFRRYGAAEGLANSFVRVIYEDSLHRLWIGTDVGLFRMRNKSFVRIAGDSGLINVHSICEDTKGRILIGGNGLLVLSDRQSAYYRSNESLADNNIRTICQTADGAVWIGTISGLRRLPRGVRGDPFRRPRLVDNLNISFLLEDHAGRLWIGCYGRGVLRYQNGRMDRFSAPSSLPHNNVLALFEDTEDNVWIGTQGGLLRLSPRAATTITTSDGAPLSINTIYQDPDGTLFVAGLNGRLFHVSNRTLAPVSLPFATSGLRIRNVFRESTGALWFGTDGQGALRLDEERVVRYTMREGLVNEFVRAFCEGLDGSIWIGTDEGLSLWRAGNFRSFTATSGLVYGSIRGLLLDRRGRLWVATDGGLSRFESGAIVTDPLLDRLRGKKVWAIHEDSDGSLWIGTQGAGLFLLKDGELIRFTTKQGLPNDKIHFITEDRRGNLWMSGPSGIAAVSRRDLEELPRHPSRQLAVRVYTTAEGLSTNQMNGGVQPAGVLAANGELWFPSTKGAVRVPPGFHDQATPLPVIIEQVIADDRAVAHSRDLRLPPGEGKIEIQYTAIRLRSPERIRFNYRMEGFDHDWTAAGQRRVAYYTNLPSGRYRFHVVAYEMNDPHNASEQSLDIELRPHYYQTRWFLALCAIVAASVAWGSYRLHVRNIRRRFAAVLDERNRLAREMHDTLIQGCVGISTLLEAASRAHDVSPKLSRDLLNRARHEVRSTVDEARMAIWNLRHGPDNGRNLAQAVSRLAERIGAETGIAIRVESTGAPFALDAEVEQNLMMLIREALQNAARHATPKNLLVRLNFDRRRLGAEIEDDGRGFDSSMNPSSDRRHYGLIGMQERVVKLGGEFTLESAPGKGTTVRLSIPVIESKHLEKRPS